MQHDWDLLVIGAGSGGVRAARIAASLGARVAIVEERFLGGTCVNVGCVPKKLFVYASHFAEEFHDAAGFGWTVGEPHHDWAALVAAKNREIARLNGVYQGLLENAGVTIIEGCATFCGAHAVEVDGVTHSAAHILVATGSTPRMPDIPGVDLAVNSDALFYLEALPASAVIVGGGYIGVEFAGILAGLGVKVHLVYRAPVLLKRFDSDIREALTSELARKGVSLYPANDVSAIELVGEGPVRNVTLASGETLQVDWVLMAQGRFPNTRGLGLEEAGVMLGELGEVLVDEHFQSVSAPSIHAVGDVINRAQLTPVALAEGMYLARHLFGTAPPAAVDYAHIPTAVFSQPAVGTVGLTEDEARARCGSIRVFRSSFRALKNTLSGNPEKTVMKLIVDTQSDRVVGAHMIGPDAGEIMQGIAIAMRAGATKAIFDGTIGIHPSSAEEFVTMREPVSA